MTTPYERRPQYQEPATHNKNSEKKGLPLWTKVTAGVGALAAAASIGGFVATGGDSKEAPASNRTVATGEAFPGQEGEVPDYSKIDVQTLTVDQFYDDYVYPQEYRIKWANEIIEEREQQAYTELNDILVSHGHPPLKPLVEPNINNTGDEINVQQDVINYIATTDPDIDEGKKLLAASADYTLARNVINEFEKGPTIAFHGVPQDSDNVELESPVFYKKAVGDYVPNGTPSKILISVNGITTEFSQSVERFIGGRWVTHSTMSTDDKDWIISPELISDN